MNAAAVAIALALVAPAPAARDETVAKGLKWLADHQKADGSWDGLNGFGPTAITATAGLALLMEGSTLGEGAFAPNIRRAVEWFEKNTSERGQLGGKSEFESFQYVPYHAQALVFLACAYDADDDPGRRERLAKVLKKGADFLADHQTKRGGWGIATGARNDYDDSQTTAVAVQALLAVRKTGLPVSKPAIDGGLAYLAAATNKDGGVIYSLAGGVRPMGNDGQPFFSAMAASGALMQDGAKADLVGRWVRSAGATNMPQQLQYLQNGGVYAMQQQCHLARLAFAVGETGHRKLDPEAPDRAVFRWAAHRETLFKALKRMQTKDGSWPDAVSGPAYVTALALVMLQLDNGYLPALAR